MTSNGADHNSLYGPLDDVCGDAGLRRRAPATAGRLLHRHQRVHRLQGLRGGLQGVERAARARCRRAHADRHVLRQHRRARREQLAARGVHRARRQLSEQDVHHARSRTATRQTRWLMSSDVCKHCTHAACLDVCPTGALVRTEFGTVIVAAGRVQRLRLLRVGLPVRRHRPARGRRPGLEVHDVLRPAARRPGARLRDGLPDRLHSVRPAGRAAGDRRRAGWPSCTPAGQHGGAAVRAGPGRRRRRGRRVLPAAGRARGLRPAAGPGRDHQGPGRRCGAGLVPPRPCWRPAWRSRSPERPVVR